MNSTKNQLIPAILLLFFLGSAAFANPLSAVEKEKGEKKGAVETSDSTSTAKSYDKVITKEAVSQKGLMSIHKVKSTYYLEIPFDLMSKPMLLAGRVTRTSDNHDVIAGQMPQNPQLVSWSADEDKVYLHNISNETVCDENTSIARSVARNFLNPVMKAFPIKAVNPDSTAVVIDVTKFFCSDERHMSPFIPSGPFDVLLGLSRISGTFQSEASSILECKAFPQNIWFRSRMVYTVSDEPFTAEVLASMILLPEKPMRPRLSDHRIGYFTDRKILYSENKDQTENISYINRWRLEPKPEDVERYKRGELVEPEKPIVYYVDDAFPEKWRPYLKLGIEDWQKAFEKIGFKNAIVARDYPKDDPDFDPNDIRNSCLIYGATTTANAMGPSWTDPRSGEIIQGSVYFYHNVIKLVHNWRFVQTGTVDPKARAEVYDNETMGNMLRYVVAHEIGHTLGLMHNMRGSYAYPVDSLRSPAFTDKYGTTASIMDYARNNYVAQPEDGVRNLLPPHLGAYDYFAIEWGYRPIFEAATPEEEKPILNQWILDKGDDPMYRYGEQEFFGMVDPASQSESLGDDAVKASRYGIENLKVLMQNLKPWSAREGEGYRQTKTLYSEVLQQFNRYMMHVLAYVGGNYLQYPVYGDGKEAFIPVSREKQKEAVDFILKSVKELPQWALNPDVLKLFDPGNAPVNDYQVSLLRALLANSLLGKIGFTAKSSADPYTPEEYLDDLYANIWERTIQGQELSENDKILEYAYVHSLVGNLELYKSEAKNNGLYTESLGNEETLAESLHFNPEEMMPCAYIEYQYALERRALTPNTKESDLKIVSRSLYFDQLQRIRSLVKKQAKSARGTTKKHYDYLVFELDRTLESF